MSSSSSERTEEPTRTGGTASQATRAQESSVTQQTSQSHSVSDTSIQKQTGKSQLESCDRRRANRQQLFHCHRNNEDTDELRGRASKPALTGAEDTHTGNLRRKPVMELCEGPGTEALNAADTGIRVEQQQGGAACMMTWKVADLLLLTVVGSECRLLESVNQDLHRRFSPPATDHQRLHLFCFCVCKTLILAEINN